MVFVVSDDAKMLLLESCFSLLLFQVEQLAQFVHHVVQPQPDFHGLVAVFVPAVLQIALIFAFGVFFILLAELPLALTDVVFAELLFACLRVGFFAR